MKNITISCLALLLLTALSVSVSASIIETAKLKPSDGAAYDYFGDSLFINGDTIVIGAPFDDNNEDNSGSAYIFERPVNCWSTTTETAKLTASDGAPNEHFGMFPVISNNTIAVGAPYDGDNGTNSGSVYIFEKPANGWATMTETAKLIPSDGAAYDYFGSSLSIDRNTLVVTSGNKETVYVLEKSGDSWVEKAQLSASDRASLDEFGFQVDISSDTVVVGARSDDDNGTDSGSVYIFKKPANGWATMTETAKLTPSDGSAYDNFGISVSISNDTVVVGSYLDDNTGADSGSAYVFEKPATGWTTMTETAKFSASDGVEGDWFGGDVSINGNTIIIGARQDDDKGFDSGSEYIFIKPESGWTTMTETAKLTASDGAASDIFGTFVSVSGSTIIASAPLDDDNGTNSGSAYIFEFDTDNDGVVNSIDNCPIIGNVNQDDSDNDGVGNACELFPWPIFFRAMINNANK